MGETKLRRVERLSMKTEIVQYLAMCLSRTSVDLVPEQGMPNRSHVDPHLMGPAGLQPAFQQSGLAQHREPPPVGHRALAAAAFHDRDFLAVRGRAGEGGVDRPV